MVRPRPRSVSRCDSSGASGARLTVIRQRWRGSGAAAERGSTSGSLRHDERARPTRTGRLARHRRGRTPAAAVHPTPRPRSAAGVRPGLAARGPADRRRADPRAAALDGPGRGPAVHRRAPVRLPARSARPPARGGGLAPEPGDPDRVRRGVRGLHGVPVGHRRSAHRRDAAVRHRLPGARRAAERPAPEAVRPVLPPRAAGGAPRVDRPDHRGHRPGRRRGRASRSTCPGSCRSSAAPGASSARCSPT